MRKDGAAARQSIFPDEDTRQWFWYAAFRRGFALLVDLLVILLGTWRTGCAAMLAFTLAFALPRRYIGGYHAGSPLRCILLSVFQALACAYIAYPLLMQAPPAVPVGLACCSAAVMHRLAPLLPPGLRADESAVTLYHRKALRIALAEILAVILFSSFDRTALALCGSLGMACAALSLVIEKIRRKKEGTQHE